MNIQGKRITLRAIEQKDLKEIHIWSNDPKINTMLGGWHFPSSLKDQQKWFETLDLKSKNQRFAIDNENGELIGMANIVDINWKDRNAFHGILLGNSSIHGKGYGTETIMTISRYAFEELGLYRLDGSIIENNTASINVYTKKCGWIKEGIKKGFYFRNNRRLDKIILGITAENYFDLIAETKYWDE